MARGDNDTFRAARNCEDAKLLEERDARIKELEDKVRRLVRYRFDALFKGLVSFFRVGTCTPVDRVLDSRSKGVELHSHFCWSCVEVSGKLLISYCLCLPSSDGYLVEQEN